MHGDGGAVLVLAAPHGSSRSSRHTTKPTSQSCPFSGHQSGPALVYVVVQELVGRHQRARAMVTDAVVDAFMQQRAMPDLWGV